MNDPIPNVDLLDQVLERVHKLNTIVVEEYDGSAWDAYDAGCDVWEQSVWLERDCGTVGCFAGWAVALAGTPSACGGVEISHQARELLGLTGEEAGRLFFSDNTLEDLTHIVQGVKEGRYR